MNSKDWNNVQKNTLEFFDKSWFDHYTPQLKKINAESLKITEIQNENEFDPGRLDWMFWKSKDKFMHPKSVLDKIIFLV
jgi:hypothetical protein